MDSTGLKIYGEGEWKVRMHGVSKRRTWRKLHVGANPQDGEIQVVLLTENNVSDDQVVEELLDSTAQKCAHLETWQHQNRTSQTRSESTCHSQKWT
jgi:predicted proteasome-type protease